MVNSVKRRSNKNIFQPFWGFNCLSVRKERIHSVNNQNSHNDQRLEDQKRQSTPKNRSDNSLRSRNASSSRKIKYLTLMMNNMCCPNGDYCVSKPVILIPNKISG